MANKDNWIQAIIRTIGFPEIFAIILGVPAMITLLSTIWHSLNTSQQWISVASIAVIVFAIVLFLFGQGRKILYHIPNILYQRHLILIKLSGTLGLDKLSQEDYINFASLVNIDAKVITSSYKNINDLKNAAPEIISMAGNKAQEAKKEQGALMRTQYYLFSKIGLKELLDKDTNYNKLGNKLEKFISILPSNDIAKAVIDYEETSRIYGTVLPMFNNELITTILPLKTNIDRGVGIQKLDKQMVLLMANVRESINKYYK